MSKQYTQLTENLVQQLAKKVKKGLSTKKACLLLDVSYHTFTKYTEGEKPEKPEWRDMISRARAGCEEYWLDVLRDDSIKNPRVKAAQIMLGALDPDRYRDRREAPQAGIVVQIVQGESGEVLSAAVTEKDGKRLPGKQLALPVVTVPSEPERT